MSDRRPHARSPRRRRALAFAAALGVAALSPAAARAEQVFFTTPALLGEFFKGSERVSYVRVESESARAALSERLGYPAAQRGYVVYVARTGPRIDGYAVVDEEPGQHEPITFGVKLAPDGRVERTEVMVYREGYGAEIREPRFRQQFTGKSAADPLRLGDDVMAVSGATISSKAMARGVRRATALVAVVRTAGLDRPAAQASAAPGGGSVARPAAH